MPPNNLSPCPDCGHRVSTLAEACPSCARPLRRPAPREGLFLRTMNQLVALVLWGPVLLLLILVVAVVMGVLWSRMG